MLRHVLLLCAALGASAFTPALSAQRRAQLGATTSSAFAITAAPISARPACLPQPAQMSLFGLGWPELLVIGGAALLFFGPDKLTNVAKEAGKSAAALKDASAAFQEGLSEASKSESPEKIAAKKDE
ncbi:hypothetical protein KFE25_000934 [Diacronema lutheri]|uniref:Uncharacterized protein n=1 Tax=Diacronema lutheri TaxID=2081491 RepID=A0A8J6C9M6_DIALT|nr:hypothetical protein KFE25_000934 [Diacronema lutheri]